MPLPFPFDFKSPDYIQVFEWRLERLNRLRADPNILSAALTHYKHNPAQYIIDWGCTFDPRNVERNLPSIVPFILFPRQEEWIEWTVERWRNQENGVTAKSREMGVTWLAVALQCSLATTHLGFVGGFGSRKEEYVDKLGDPQSILQKARMYLSLLPLEFRGGWNEKKYSAHMRLQIPEMGSLIKGEAGDGMGRGDRTSLYMKDEAAHLQRPELIEAAVSMTTNCCIDMSTPFGTNNPFARKFLKGLVPSFRFHWREDPRKDDAWYEKKVKMIDDPVIVAQEIDLDFSASIEGVLIPSAWVQASIDAHKKLNLEPEGKRKMALDVADRGKDKNAWVSGKHFLIDSMERWSGADGDIFKSVERACFSADLFGCTQITYDADGLGAGVRGDARVINEQRKHKIEFLAFQGSGGVVAPDDEPFMHKREYKDAGRTNLDYFMNRKAQAWWALRMRFLRTYRAIVEGAEFEPDEIISLDSSIKELSLIMMELSQPTYSQSMTGKLLVDKQPDDALSPNCADAIMMFFAPIEIRRSAYEIGFQN